MSIPSSTHVRFIKFTGIVLAAYMLAGFAFGDTAPIQAATVNANGSTVITNAEPRKLEAWHTAMEKILLPKSGCFTAAYPVTKWKEVACIAAPPIPMTPRTGPRPLVVGNTDDISAQAPSGFISQGIGSFDTVTGVTSASSPIGNSGTSVANAYTLQLNTNFFASTACTGSPNASCQGWEQFVFYNNGTAGTAFIQYWLLNYNTACPAGWTQFSFTGSTSIYCYRNSSAVAVPNQTISNLGNMVLTGTVAAGSDSATLSTGANLYSVTGINAVNAAAGWTAAEFNIFGAGGNSSGGGQLTFNNGSVVVPRTRIFYGGTGAPNCLAQGFTGETNNLTFGPTPPASSPPGPAVFFTESIAGGAGSNCAAATTIGDTHLHTLGGLFYDFQATGDFILAQADSDFVVQSRQVSGAPTWPDASVNHAVATQMGNTKIAVCLAPNRRLVVDGTVTPLNDNQPFLSPDGVTIWRKGNVYTITSKSGNSVRATVNDTWIDANVGLGRWPSTVTGLLANVNGNPDQIAARGGTVLTAPFSFQDLYHLYADSWRVSKDQSLLSACSNPGQEETIEIGAPSKPFYAKDLEPALYQSARTVCTDAGVREGTLLDACILDVAVIGNKAAANVYVGMTTPSAIGVASTDVKPLSKNKSPLLPWILIIIIVLLIICIIFRSRKTPMSGRDV